ncbi:MAG: protein adenylyltransferase SelO [Alphaproteobacteria bacterium]
MTIAFENSYARLPERFYAKLPPTPVGTPRLLMLNRALAQELGLDADWLASPEGADMLAGNAVPAGAEPIAMAYAGHQFGNWVPQLGDGRAILLGEVVDGNGERRDIQLKGAGRTPFSRMGDGRAWLGPVLREYLVSEAMAALGIATTRSLAAVATGETVLRERPLPGAILTRVAKSHVRVGTFQFFAARGDVDALRTLADHVIARHDSDLAGSETPYRDLLDRVVARQAELIANWQGVGFIHGVMNTDNMSIAGETIDYGPCAFMDRFHPGQVYSSIDHTGRYAYANQPRIAHWNLACFAQALVPLLGADEDAGVAVAQSVVDSFPARFAAAQLRGLRAKLGLCEARDDDAELARELWPIMAAGRADFTNTFRALNHAALTGDLAPARAAFETASAFDAWAERWRARLSAEAVSDEHRAGVMRRANPAVIPRNHRVEEALAAAEHGDLAPFVRLLTVLARPFDDQPDAADLATPPRPDEEIEATFCGT